ncbi:MAG: cupin domain-containing protein [Steroidobacteraceae bacterium]|nr:cupin domain-containing protein [Steroidobacteraceae bacterium]
MNVTTALRVPAVAATLTLLLFPLVKSAEAQAEEKDGAIVTPLLSRELVGIPGKDVAMVKVEYLPGGASLSHRHDANVLVYVLEGSVIMQVQGQAPVTLKAGDTFFETPTDIHLQSANASKTEPAKFIAIVIKDKGAPVTRPVTPAQHTTHAPRP